MEEANRTVKRRKLRNTHACCFCRLSRKPCVDHPHANRQPGKCKSCLDDELPCGAYETAEETREFLKKAVMDQHTTDGHISQPTATIYNFHERQPTAPEPHVQHAEPLHAPFMSQSSASDTGFEDSQLSTNQEPSQETFESSASSNGPTAATLMGSPVPREASLDTLYPFTNPFTDLGTLEPLSSEPQSYYVEEDDSAVLSIFDEHDLLRMAQNHVVTETQVLRSQELEFERAVRIPIQHTIENIEKDLERVFEQMLTEFDYAQRHGKVGQARWICARIEGVPEERHMSRTHWLAEARRKELLLKIREFHTNNKDVSGADRISCDLLQSGTFSESKALSLFAESIEKSLERGFAETEHVDDIIPPLHRLAALGNVALFPILQKAAASGEVPRRDFIGQTILHVAASKGHTYLLEYLLALRISHANFPGTEDRDGVGRTAVYLAICHGQTSAYHLLISRGASLDVRDFQGNSPLTMACRGNHHAIVEDLILKWKRPVNERPLNYMGSCQPLHAAAEGGCQDAVHILMENGADPQIVKRPGRKTAAQLARDKGHLGVAAYIEARGQGNRTLP